ncbi:MAG: HlyD family efflux transporter periplasmic adaptor subunit [Candidatus Omnitrophota bacterium]
MNKNTIIPELKREIDQEEKIPNIIIQDREKNSLWKPLRLFLIPLAICLFFVAIIKIDFPVSGISQVVPSQLLTVEALESGIMENVFFASGEKVEHNEVIAMLHNYDLMRDLQETKLQINMVRKKLLQLDRKRNYLRLTVDNHTELYNNEIIARSELEKIKLEYAHELQEYDIYKDEMETLRNKTNYLQEALGHMNILAPISGILLTKIENKQGTFVKRGDIICQIGNMNDFLLELPINEKFIDNFSVGEKATIRFSAYAHKPVNGTVIKIQHTAWEKLKKVLVKENVITVIIKPDDMSLPVKPGMSAHVKIHSGHVRFRWMQSAT